MRLIDADALMELYKMRGELKEHEKLLSVPIPVIQQNIKDMPTIDAEPVKHGRWIYKPYENDEAVCLYHCSECNDVSALAWNYCRECGAKMDLEADNG